MRPLKNRINENKIAPIEEKKEGKLYFYSKNYDILSGCYNDVETVEPTSLYDRDLESSRFWNELKKSTQITIIDNFWDKSEISKLINILKECNIVSKIDFQFLELFIKRFKENQELLNELKRMLGDKFRAYNLEDDIIHDRLAILDNELYHFGGTVGGKSSEGFTAYSSGWDAKKISLLIKCLESDKNYATKRL